MRCTPRTRSRLAPPSGAIILGSPLANGTSRLYVQGTQSPSSAAHAADPSASGNSDVRHIVFFALNVVHTKSKREMPLRASVPRPDAVSSSKVRHIYKARRLQYPRSASRIRPLPHLQHSTGRAAIQTQRVLHRNEDIVCARPVDCSRRDTTRRLSTSTPEYPPPGPNAASEVPSIGFHFKASLIVLVHRRRHIAEIVRRAKAALSECIGV